MPALLSLLLCRLTAGHTETQAAAVAARRVAGGSGSPTDSSPGRPTSSRHDSRGTSPFRLPVGKPRTVKPVHIRIRAIAGVVMLPLA